MSRLQVIGTFCNSSLFKSEIWYTKMSTKLSKLTSTLTLVRMSRTISILLGVVVVALIGTTYYFYSQYQTLKMNPEEASRLEADALIAEVSKLIVLPTDETPTVATVTDPEALKGQTFFANAKKGDQVLIYATAQKAVLYDPVAKKVIEVAPVNIGGSDSPSNLPSTSTSGGN